MAVSSLDVRLIPPSSKHKSIFERWNATGIGDTLEIVNDHDPRPLYYQFEAELGGTFQWDYIESGPEVWRVHITRVAS